MDLNLEHLQVQGLGLGKRLVLGKFIVQDRCRLGGDRRLGHVARNTSTFAIEELSG